MGKKQTLQHYALSTLDKEAPRSGVPPQFAHEPHPSGLHQRQNGYATLLFSCCSLPFRQDQFYIIHLDFTTNPFYLFSLSLCSHL